MVPPWTLWICSAGRRSDQDDRFAPYGNAIWAPWKFWQWVNYGETCYSAQHERNQTTSNRKLCLLKWRSCPSSYKPSCARLKGARDPPVQIRRPRGRRSCSPDFSLRNTNSAYPLYPESYIHYHRHWTVITDILHVDFFIQGCCVATEENIRRGCWSLLAAEKCVAIAMAQKCPTPVLWTPWENKNLFLLKGFNWIVNMCHAVANKVAALCNWLNAKLSW